jgi:hypothetical protein
MKTALALLFCVTVVASAAEDSPLVKAAKASGGPRRKSKAKVITNGDVKKSKGKLVELPPPSPQATAPQPAAPEKGIIEQHDEQRRAAKEASERVAAAAQKVADLEKELARLEQSYYESADPNYRDHTIEARFQQTKNQLETARKDLADARDAAQKVTKPSS